MDASIPYRIFCLPVLCMAINTVKIIYKVFYQYEYEYAGRVRGQTRLSSSQLVVPAGAPPCAPGVPLSLIHI